MALLAKSGSRETDCSSTTKSWAGHFNDFRSARIRAPSASISSKIQKTNLAPFWFERNFFEYFGALSHMGEGKPTDALELPLNDRSS